MDTAPIAKRFTKRPLEAAIEQPVVCPIPCFQNNAICYLLAVLYVQSICSQKSTESQNVFLVTYYNYGEPKRLIAGKLKFQQCNPKQFAFNKYFVLIWDQIVCLLLITAQFMALPALFHVSFSFLKSFKNMQCKTFWHCRRIS